MKSGSGCPDPCGPPSEERGGTDEGDKPRGKNGGRASGMWKICLLYTHMIIFYVLLLITIRVGSREALGRSRPFLCRGGRSDAADPRRECQTQEAAKARRRACAWPSTSNCSCRPGKGPNMTCSRSMRPSTASHRKSRPPPRSSSSAISAGSQPARPLGHGCLAPYSKSPLGLRTCLALPRAQSARGAAGLKKSRLFGGTDRCHASRDLRSCVGWPKTEIHAVPE